MRGLAPDKLTIDQLREIVSVMSRRGGGVEPPRLSSWSRKQCIEWLNTAGPPPNGVGTFCRNLLRSVVGKTDEGHPMGLSYNAMVRLVNEHFPNAQCDEKHLRWYATRLRAKGESFPVHRESSKWKVKKKGAGK